MDLCSLPNDILILIAESLEERNDRLSLARCCHHFHDVLMPVAFTNIDVQSNCPFVLSCLVHLILRNPRYGESVRSLNLAFWLCDHPLKCRFKRKLMLGAIRRLTQNEEDIEAWENCLRDKPETGGWGQADGWRAMLLTLVPNLEVLSIHGELVSALRGKIVTRASRGEKPFNTVPVLGHLREVNLRGWLEHAPASLEDDIIPFLTFPTMRELSLTELYDDGKCEDNELPTESGISKLAFWESNSQTGFRSIVRACKELKNFAYVHRMDSEGQNPLNPTGIYETLLHHVNSLEHIVVSYDIKQEASDPKEDAFLGSLNRFTRLKQLRIRATNLLPWDSVNKCFEDCLMGVLPPSLELLDIDDCHRTPNPVALVEQFEDFYRNSDAGSYDIKCLTICGAFLEWHSGTPDGRRGGGPPKEFWMRLGARLTTAVGSGCFLIVDANALKEYGNGLVPKWCYRPNAFRGT
ncbi:uncharacterized protein DSM5745_08640 [Aspergillus mulundensis]|uniref:Leucine-rich repeat domain-containing protein n=1 Tax=Aspergillus mulundensis TaxID=1810919 RepID=A0A3D8R4I2_9EURO|nr:hypothetical protein DSM5745_08640 [Aspergillus mulundensis]RDW68880.1 hypothetical protein DSM5745_08640 [Aspergillus mulundensis]